MRHILLPLLFLFSNPLLSQELVEFENGQVADADDLNQSLQYLLSRIETLESRVDQLEPREWPTYTVQGGDALQADGLTFSGVAEYVDWAYTGQTADNGKHYWEVTAQCGPDTAGVKFGVVGTESAPSLADQIPIYDLLSIFSDGARIGGQGSSRYFDGSFLSTAPDDVFLIAVDLDNGFAFFGKNGVWEGSSNPATGENPAFQNLSGSYHAFVSGWGRECLPNTFVTNFGASDFTYSVPSGYFKGYCPTNDCEVAD